MLTRIANVLTKYEIVLASQVRYMPILPQPCFNISPNTQSPRRFDLLSNLGLRFQVVASTFEENLNKADFDTPDLYVIETAKQKTLEVAARVDLKKPFLIIGSDTLVVSLHYILVCARSYCHRYWMDRY